MFCNQGNGQPSRSLTLTLKLISVVHKTVFHVCTESQHDKKDSKINDLGKENRLDPSQCHLPGRNRNVRCNFFVCSTFVESPGVRKSMDTPRCGYIARRVITARARKQSSCVVTCTARAPQIARCSGLSHLPTTWCAWARSRQVLSHVRA